MYETTHGDVTRLRDLGDEFAAVGPRDQIFGIQLHRAGFDNVTAFAPTARHRYYELIYVERGEGSTYIGSQFLRLQRGELILLAPGCYHVHPDPAHYVLWVLRFRPAAVEAAKPYGFVPSLGEVRHSHIPEPERTRWENRLGYLHEELNAVSVDIGIVSMLLRATLLDVAKWNRHSRPGVQSKHLGVLETVFRYIDLHYRSVPRLKDIATAVNFSPAYLTDLVRRETGRPIHQWINTRRIRAAESLLAETDLAIGAIAEEVGFRDPTYFGRYFSKVTGQTPRSWRNAHQSNAPQHWPTRTPWRQDETAITQDQYSRLQTFARLCGTVRTRDEIEDLAAYAAAQIFRTSLVQILRRDEHEGTFVISCQRGMITPPGRATIREDAGMLPLVVAGQAVVVSNLGDSPISFFKNIGRLGFRSLMTAPIWMQNRCVGAIRLLQSERQTFDENERRILAMLGTIAGFALLGSQRELSVNLSLKPFDVSRNGDANRKTKPADETNSHEKPAMSRGYAPITDGLIPTTGVSSHIANRAMRSSRD